MKKILIIDDNIDRWSAKISPFVNNVSLTQDPSEFFDYDKAGNFCNLKFEKNDYEYVFIHHSQSGDSLLPSSLIDLIKNHLGLNLILFSGNIEQSFENKERENFYFRSLRRSAMQDNIVFFIKESLKDGDCWDIEIFYYEYTSRQIGKIILLQDEGITNEDLFTSKPMDKFLRLKGIERNSTLFDDLYRTTGAELIHKLRNFQ